MDLSQFDFHLPEHLIAQTPKKERSSSRLMVLHRQTQIIEHKHFHQIVDELNEGDCLVLNNTKVLPARLLGEKMDTNAHIELLLLKQVGSYSWEALVKPAKRVKIGTEISFGDGLLRATCIGIGEDGARTFDLIYEGIFYEILEQLGEMPLPPYIREKLAEKGRYQTVYAQVEGSAAAPTAGLHFTDELLEEIRGKGVNIAFITLHVGLGTFRPVNVENVLEHKMHEEYFEMNEETAKLLNETRAKGKRIIAVGTTSTRTLETIASTHDGKFVAKKGWTSIFIYPGYEYKAVDALITNFHLPKSTLLMLISALATKDFIMKAYEEAIKEEYRFFSFGDAMFITN